MIDNILVTGGAGFIGSNLALELQNRLPGANIKMFDKFNNGERRSNNNFKYFGNFMNLRGFNGKIIAGDLASKKDVEFVLENDYDIIYHQGAISDTTVLNQEEVINTNSNSLSFFRLM